MSLSSTQQAAFNRQIGRMKEDGFFLPAQRSLSGETRYLIISYGGTGAAALFGVKKQFEAVLPKDQLDKRVRFLAIDTDEATQKLTKEVVYADGTKEIIELDSLDNNQFMQLAGSHAKLCLDDAAANEWLNSDLKARIKVDNTLLNGKGASGTRQVGRLTLYASQNAQPLVAKVQNMVGQLTNGHSHPLRVFILTGIAGGTGSGTVIDLTYLIRNTLESMPGNVDRPEKNTPTRSQYCGFILLPPTGDSTDPTYVSHGNCNGYAALKEINHFMTLSERNSTYGMTYSDGNVVTSEKNIFDVCYLLDGTSDGVAFDKPREKAIAVLSESILDMVCASQTTKNGEIQAVDSFMNDQSTMRAQMIAKKSVNDAMRDADYIYCALGHSEFAMPIHEIKAYVAKQMFDRIYKLFQNCGNVEEDDVKNLLKNILRKGAKTGSATTKSMDEELETWFTNPRGGKGGPFFTINLLRDLVDEIRNQRKKLKIARIGMASDEELNNIEKYALHVNNTTFDVYTAAMEALKTMMDEQYDVVVKSGKNGNTYSFIPDSMGSIGDTEHVIKYLNGLINKGSLYQLTEAMLHEMIDNRDEWTALVRSDDLTAAPKAMRRFWNTQLDRLITSTMEDFLIKYYSGDPDAYYSQQTHVQTYPYLQQAANAIYTQMLGVGGSAQPMAGFTGKGLQPSDFNAHTYLMVPQCAPNLYNELCQIASNASAGLAVNVCTSMASDRISCYKQYTSIPTFKLEWVCAAESDYETLLKTTAAAGIHMSETEGGKQWRNLPNLLPKSSWSIVPTPRYENSREKALALRAEELFDRANSLNLVTPMHQVSGIANFVHSIKVLPKAFRPDDKLFQNLDQYVDGSAAKEQRLAIINEAVEKHATELYAKVSNWESDTNIAAALETIGFVFESHDLHFPGCVMTVGPADSKPADWDEYMAKCMLRKLPDVMNEVSGTVMVMEKLAAKISDVLRRQTLVSQFAHYLITDMFHYNEGKKRWQYLDQDDAPQVLVVQRQKAESQFHYYPMFTAFRNKSDAIVESLYDQMKAVAPIIEDDEPCKNYNDKEATFEKNAAKLLRELKEWCQEPPIDSDIKGLEGMGYKTKAIKNFYRTLYAEVKERSKYGFNQDLFFHDISGSRFEEDDDIPVIDDDNDDDF